ncbi:hypothetical protein BE20_14470 [Sorangium cellulosum]|nr:hypothetical protein BE20_14470 [Sorangium cellulosum]
MSAPASPETRVALGLLLPATQRRRSCGSCRSSARSVSATGSSTRAIPPAPLACSTSRPRAQMIRAASSRLSAPATCAAATSPRLCPTTASGSTPQDRHSAASATWIAKMAGWTTSEASSRRGLPAVSAVMSEEGACGRIASSHRRSAARNTGSSRRRSRPMRSHCDPWPPNRKATFGRCAPATPIEAPRRSGAPASPRARRRASSSS